MVLPPFSFIQLLNVNNLSIDIVSIRENKEQKILSENTNCQLAMRGLGDAAYRKQDMKTAMQFFKEAEDKEES